VTWITYVGDAFIRRASTSLANGLRPRPRFARQRYETYGFTDEPAELLVRGP
jgi:hypothetical protein